MLAWEGTQLDKGWPHVEPGSCVAGLLLYVRWERVEVAHFAESIPVQTERQKGTCQVAKRRLAGWETLCWQILEVPGSRAGALVESDMALSWVERSRWRLDKGCEGRRFSSFEEAWDSGPWPEGWDMVVRMAESMVTGFSLNRGFKCRSVEGPV